MKGDGRMINNTKVLIEAYEKLCATIIHDNDPERKRCYHELNEAFMNAIRAEAIKEEDNS